MDRSTVRLIMAILAVLMGLYFVILAPGQIDVTQDGLMWKQTKQGEAFGPGPISRLFIGTFFRGALIMAGLTLIAIAYELYRGKKWAWPLALFCLAVAPVGAFFIGLGFMENLKAYPPAWTVFIIGLIGFWAMLLLQENNRQTKVTLFITATLVGMIGSQAFTLFPHFIRLVMRDYAGAISDPTVQIMRHSGPIMFILIGLTMAAIPLLAKKKETGWWLALISGLGVAVAGFPVHYYRPTASLVPEGTFAASPLTSTYFMAGVQGVILVVILLLPYFRNSLIASEEEIEITTSTAHTG